MDPVTQLCVCPPTETLSSGVCVCRSGFYRFSPGQICCAANMYAPNGVCICKPGFNMTNGVCVCPLNEYLSNGVCLCLSGTTRDSITGRCCPANQTYSVATGSCQCKTTYVPSGTGNTCVCPANETPRFGICVCVTGKFILLSLVSIWMNHFDLDLDT